VVRNAVPWALLALVVGGGVWSHMRTSDELRELRARDSVLVDSLAEQAKRTAESEREVARTDSLAVASIARAQLGADVAVRVARGASSRLRALAGDNAEIIAELDALEAAHAAERATWERRDVLRLAQIQTRDDLIDRQRAQLATQAELVINLRGQVSALNPPFVVKLLRDIPKLAAAAAVGALVIK